jgi:hypothetical protein
LNAVRGSPLFSPCRERDVHRLVPDGTMVLVGLSVDHFEVYRAVGWRHFPTPVLGWRQRVGKETPWLSC